MRNYIFLTTTLSLLLNVASLAQNKKTIPSSDSVNLRQQNIVADNVLLKAFETGDVSKLDLIIDPEFLNSVRIAS